MDTNAAPLDTLQRSRLTPIALGFAVFIFLALALSTSGTLSLVLLAIPAFVVVYTLFFAVWSIEFFPMYIAIKSILRTRRIERADVDFVSMEEYTTRSGGIPRTVKYVRVKLRSGRKIDLSGFQEDIQSVYEKLKLCESTNEEWLRGR